MNKQILLLFLVLVIGYLSLVFCEENVERQIHNYRTIEVKNNDSKELFDEARTKRRHKFFHHLWGWHALAIAYWIKVKVVIVSFFVGSAIFLGLRYFWPHKCSPAITHEGPIIYSDPHSFSSHHDHVPYSYGHADHFDHSFDSNSFEPYSGYASSYSDSAPPPPSSIIGSGGPPDIRSRKRRSKKSIEQQQQQQTQVLSMEEKIAELMFAFLGLGSKACRRRFICEMEFRSKLNPLSSMAFRIVGRGFFEKYTNERNTDGRASSFRECATVNADCVFVEENVFDLAVNESAELNTNLENTTKVGEDYKVVDGEKSKNMESQNEINIAEEKQQLHQHSNRKRAMHRKLNKVARRTQQLV